MRVLKEGWVIIVMVVKLFVGILNYYLIYMGIYFFLLRVFNVVRYFYYEFLGVKVDL